MQEKNPQNIRPMAEKFYLHLKVETGKEKMLKGWLLHKVPRCKLFVMLPLKLLTLVSISKSIGNPSHPECNSYICVQNRLVSFHCSPNMLLGIMFLDVEKGRRTMERYHCLICLLLRTVFKRHLSSPMVQTSYPYEFFVIFSLTFQMEIIKICTRQNSIMDLYIPNPQLYHYQLIADLIVFIYPFRAPFP